jgi:ubiquinone biosynthesis protein UbiJ
MPELPETEGLQKFVRTKYVTEEGYELKAKINHVQSSNGDKATTKRWQEFMTEEEKATILAIKEKAIARMNDPKRKLQAQIEREQARLEKLIAQRDAMED